MLREGYLIVFDQLSDERRDVAHEIIKANANGWWHNMPNVWIVGDHDAAFWRDILQPVISGTGASVLVLHLPPPGGRGWAHFGPGSESKTEWFYRAYTGSKRD